ncbi:MAG: type I methionyl aminopeptidase [Deltaproteobacteria bacterium]|nr:type I methionyl aminopeptidase [Deltaproteobacteria bacterium]
MRIQLKSLDEIRLMREAGLVLSAILDEICAAAKPGVSTWELDRIARAGIEKHRVKSLFLGYASPPYPAVLCTSINEVIVHGIPRKNEVIKDGDIIGIDFGIGKQGFCADSARTIMVGEVSPEKKKLVETTREALNAAIDMCRIGNRIGDIGSAVQKYAEERGYSVVRQFVGHGIGQRMHEEPAVPNFGAPNEGKRLKRGLVIAVEPMVNAGAPDVELLDDGWTAVTKDRRLSAHFEHTIAILDEGPWVLTRASSTPGNPGND